MTDSATSARCLSLRSMDAMSNEWTRNSAWNLALLPWPARAKDTESDAPVAWSAQSAMPAKNDSLNSNRPSAPGACISAGAHARMASAKMLKRDEANKSVVVVEM